MEVAMVLLTLFFGIVFMFVGIRVINNLEDLADGIEALNETFEEWLEEVDNAPEEYPEEDDV